jgi:hypothetical protein
MKCNAVFEREGVGYSVTLLKYALCFVLLVATCTAEHLLEEEACEAALGQDLCMAIQH